MPVISTGYRNGTGHSAAIVVPMREGFYSRHRYAHRLASCTFRGPLHLKRLVTPRGQFREALAEIAIRADENCGDFRDNFAGLCGVVGCYFARDFWALGKDVAESLNLGLAERRSYDVIAGSLLAVMKFHK